jgi:hypothetical protein
MIRCLPAGLCSWNYRLAGDGRQAATTINWFSEQGTIAIAGVAFDVRKQGVMSGRWTLERQGAVVISAEKPSLLTRTYELHNAEAHWTVSAESALGRGFRVQRDGATLGTIRPDHPFTRRATIELFKDRGDFPAICFAFWLVVLAWRRAASSKSS